ncbi:hypothetical protein [Tepidibacter thalassicus]|uniref:Uncharacterized protein n=1 Tax=Tepidibacter thalassicus DSM 15285 TaxID=1123350 RepID=A0A1M5SAR8_9FIRM|nr:hypothetical protein [Tepidibacter thalassicus]SHH35013.1 hypothetical protein SAMN02744040_01672 [Tepidibacter thalassicus DSM 15285]
MEISIIWNILNTVLLIYTLYFLFTFIFKIPKKIYAYLDDLDAREKYREIKK